MSIYVAGMSLLWSNNQVLILKCCEYHSHVPRCVNTVSGPRLLANPDLPGDRRQLYNNAVQMTRFYLSAGIFQGLSSFPTTVLRFAGVYVIFTGLLFQNLH